MDKIKNMIKRVISDKLYIKMVYKKIMKKKMNFRNPKTFNEKLQWLKIYDRNPLYVNLVDKYEVKKYIAEILGEEYIIPTLGVWDKAEYIDFESLPQQFVLKTTHDSGGIFICRDKSSADIEYIKEKMKRFLTRRYFYVWREWPYKKIKPRIIAEQYMADESGTELNDYKFFCFGGEFKLLYIISNRGKDTTRLDFFDADFNHLPIKHCYPNAETQPSKPDSFEKMKELAKMLSQKFPHVRVDFYDIDGRIYFGEFTFYTSSGLIPYDPDEWDYTLGGWIDLSKAYAFRKKNSLDFRLKKPRLRQMLEDVNTSEESDE